MGEVLGALPDPEQTRPAPAAAGVVEGAFPAALSPVVGAVGPLGLDGMPAGEGAAAGGHTHRHRNQDHPGNT